MHGQCREALNGRLALVGGAKRRRKPKARQPWALLLEDGRESGNAAQLIWPWSGEADGPPSSRRSKVEPLGVRRRKRASAGQRAKTAVAKVDGAQRAHFEERQ